MSTAVVYRDSPYIRLKVEGHKRKAINGYMQYDGSIQFGFESH